MTTELCLHAGAAVATRTEVEKTLTPIGTRTWQPIAHSTLIANAENSLRVAGLKISGEQHALARDGRRYFGILDINGNTGGDGFALAVGLRNSHDRSTVAELCMGTRVFVCDNLAFSGEVQISRKHTSRILDDLPRLIDGAVDRLLPEGERLRHRVDRYRTQRLHDVKAHDLIISAVDRKIISNRRIAQVVQEWREPTYPDFAPRTAWSLFNAFTEILKQTPAITLQRRTARLHRMFDAFIGLAV